MRTVRPEIIPFTIDTISLRFIISLVSCSPSLRVVHAVFVSRVVSLQLLMNSDDMKADFMIPGSF